MAKTRIVVAEDQAMIRKDLVEMLNGLEYEVVGDAPDGEVAIRLAREFLPDIVIMDIRMPGLDGIEAARILTNERIAPVLLITAQNQRELVDQAREAGVVSFVFKPFEHNDIRAAIEISLQRYREFRALEREIGDLKETLETRKIVERAKGILMRTQGLSEDDAYKRMQRLSMNTRKSMREIAEAVLITHEVEK